MKVQIYTRETCMFCKKAKAWFAEHHVPYEEIDVTASADFAAMKEKLNATTVPQILIDGHLIGGYDTLKEYETPILEKLRTAYPAA